MAVRPHDRRRVVTWDPALKVLEYQAADSERIEIDPSPVLQRPRLCLPIGFQAGDASTGKTFTSGTTYATYLGRAVRELVGVKVRYRVTSAIHTVVWAEVAIARGRPRIDNSARLTVLGYTDVSAVLTSTGRYTTTITVADVRRGDDLWALVGASSGGPLVLQGGLPDVLESGFNVSAAATRPSTQSDGTTYATEGGTTESMWLTWSAK